MKLIKLKPKINGKYHFGESALEESLVIFHSDSLFSAIVNNYVKLYGDSKEDIEKLKSIKISSLFPAYKDVLFIPKPFTKLIFKGEEQKKVDEKPKQIKKVEFISLNALKNHNKGTLEFEDDLLIYKKFLITKEEKKDRINFDYFEEQKITIDRNKGITLEMEKKGQLFDVGYIKPSENIYFYFLIEDDVIDEDIRKKLYASIRLIQDEGLGGKRTTGAGLFESIEFCEHSDFEDYIKSNSDKKHFMSLSLTLPKDEEEFKKCDAYHLIERRGYIYHPTQMTKRKKSIMMLSEGSIFSNKVEGKIVDVAPENNNYEVFKFGKFFGIPINVKQDKNE